MAARSDFNPASTLIRMQIASPHHQRALSYVAAVQSQGYRMSVAELQAFVDAAVPLTPSDVMAHTFGLTSFIRVGVVDALVNTGWLALDGDRLSITDLGRAVVAGMEAEEPPGVELINVALDPADPLSYARLIGHFAGRGDALLVDPYFSIDHLQDILLNTQISKILTDEQSSKGRVEALRAAVTGGELSRNLEVRLAPHVKMHDRYLIPEDGPVDMIGTSINGVGKRPTAIVQLHSGSDEIRRLHKEIWDSATPIQSPDARGA